MNSILLTLAILSQSSDVVLVEGAAGAAVYQKEFAAWGQTLRQSAEASGATVTYVGGASSPANGGAKDRERLAATIKTAVGDAEKLDVPLWIILIGHGTHDGRDARFNLRGPDITEKWMASELTACKRPLAVVCCFSASSPFLNALSGPGRVVITATRSGAERNFSRFGQFFAEAIDTKSSQQDNRDLDKDGQTSLLEAFLYASKRTEQFYADENRLATEHALLDDNGDQRGTPADWFRGIRAIRSPKDGALDGLAATQRVLAPSARERNAPPEFRKQRDGIEREIAALRKQRATMDADAYYGQLEPLMLKLATLYAGLDDESR